MIENDRTNEVRNRSNTSDDEIELIDIFRVIWKWKYLIIGGTLIFALAGMIVSSFMTKQY
jgi:LPS O-antigen subunit length determinant protein (WzzB/FepE family)